MQFREACPGLIHYYYYYYYYNNGKPAPCVRGTFLSELPFVHPALKRLIAASRAQGPTWRSSERDGKRTGERQIP